MSPSTTPKKSLRIGVMMEAIQLADVMSIDIFGNLSTTFVDLMKPLSAKAASFADHAIDMEFLYIATTLEPTGVVPGNNFRFMPTHTYDNCPRNLDIVLIGGPVPSHRPPQADQFMKEAWTKTPVWITTCTGSLWLASAGVLEGKKCTTNREFVDTAKQLYPNSVWVDQGWVMEEKPFDGPGGKGELWTSGAAGYGLKMIANYCLKRYDREFVTFMSLQGLDLHQTTERDQFYPK